MTRLFDLLREPPPIILVKRFDDRDLNQAANDIILAMDGKIRRADALLCARAALESMGMEKRK